MTDGEDLPRQARWLPPPSWLLPGSDEPIPQTHIELAAVATELQSAGLGLPQWIDTPWRLDPVKVKAMGYAGINRYMCADYNTGPGTSLPQKRVVYAELQGMLDAGLDFTWNYEDAAGDFQLGYDVWRARGQHAADYGANILKLPAGSGCYASCDQDVGWAMSTTQLASQRGFHDGYELGPAGIYGSTVAINNTTQAGTASLGWITLAKSWNHNIPAALGAAHLDQVGSAFGGSADTNNVLQIPHATYLQAQGEDMPTPEEYATAVWAQVLAGGVSAGTRLVNTGTDAAKIKELTTNIILDINHPQSLPAIRRAVDALPTAQQVAAAVLAAGGGGGLSEAQLIDVLNRTGLSVAEATP